MCYTPRRISGENKQLNTPSMRLEITEGMNKTSEMKHKMRQITTHAALTISEI